VDKSQIGVVIPAYNESETIKVIINAVMNYGIPIIVNDGSTDETETIAMKCCENVVSHSKNLGYDAALNSGFKKAFELGVKTVITLDADGQHNPELIHTFIEKIESGADVVVGIRNAHQRFAERVFALYTKLRFGIEDPLCGLKAYKIQVYNALGYFDSYKSIGTELAIFALSKKYSVKQVKFNTLKRTGQSRFGHSIRGNYKIIRALVVGIYHY